MDENQTRKYHPAQWPEELLLKQCTMSTTRRSGPGGQNRNKVETAVIFTHNPTGINAEANERRTQGENRRIALRRLRLRLALEFRCAITEPENGESYSPTALWLKRCQGSRLVISPEHDEYPAMIAEALDQLVFRKMDMSSTAVVLRTTASQLNKLFQIEPLAWIKFNQLRREHGLPAR